ncbi:hypothetical protein NMY22_g1818 [Coprinellus aureogranulatus]|nr:hypothetical protein NMY22_g1818 [Coprinellus aureogranulatus]
MLEFSQTTAVGAALGLWTLYSAVCFFGKTKKLSHIPSVGFDDPVLSYISALQLVWDPPGYIRKAWTTIPAGVKFVKVPTLTSWMVITAHPEVYQELARAPERWVSAQQGIEEILHLKYTTLTVTDHPKDNIQIPPIKEKLTRTLGELVPEVHDELRATFEDEFPSKGEEWQPLVAFPSVIKLVARISNRVLVGQTLCRNAEFIGGCISYANEVFVMSYLISLFPEFIRPMVNRIISPMPRRIRKMEAFLQPLLDERKAALAKQGDDYRPPMIFLNWLAESAEKNGKDDREVILRTMLVNFGSIHTTSITFTHALFSLLSLIGNRLTVEDCTIADTFIPKGTMVCANMVDAHFHPSMWGDNANEFDPYRFIKLEKETGKVIQLPTSTLYTMTFGYGRHACPGRFFAGQEVKLMMAFFLHYYDLKLDERYKQRPSNLWFGMANMPNGSAKVLMRRRTMRDA